MKETIIILLILLGGCTPGQQKNDADENIYAIMDENAAELFKTSKAYSISIGIVKDGNTYTKHYGEIDKGKGNRANDSTYFEAASITKTFTGYLIAKAVLDKKISLDDDVRKYLKESFPNLEYNGIPITIRDLLSYESAIPSVLPDDRELMRTHDDSTTFRLERLNKNYTKSHFLEGLHNLKLDTIPGKTYLYSNPSLELLGLMLENIYGKPYETLLNEYLFSKVGITHTKFELNENEELANGYNTNFVLMPHFSSNLWGASGTKTKSTLGDLVKLLNFQLDKENKIAQESQRVLDKSKGAWFGYLWDRLDVSEKGKICYKHGGAYGNQILFTLYPELNMGICIIINISGPETFGALANSVFNIANDLTTSKTSEKEVYGYYFEKDNIVFSYKHPDNMDTQLIKNIYITGSFNNWEPGNTDYQMIGKGNGLFELSLPKSRFEKGQTYMFKFVMNGTSWVVSPNNALNVENTPDRNLTFKID